MESNAVYKKIIDGGKDNGKVGKVVGMDNTVVPAKLDLVLDDGRKVTKRLFEVSPVRAGR